MDDGRAAVRFTDDLGNPGPQLAQGPDLGDRHELVVVGEHSKVGHGGSDAAGDLPRRVGAQIVKRRPVHGDRPHTLVAGYLLGQADDLRHRRGRTVAERRRERVGPQINRHNRALIGFDVVHQLQQDVAGRPVIGAGIEDHRCHAQIDALEHFLQLPGRHTRLPHSDQQRADPFAEPGKYRGVELLRRDPGHPVGRNCLGDLPSGLDVPQRIGTTQIGPLTRQRRLGQFVQRSVERPDRDSLVGPGLQHLFGLWPQFVGLAPGALGQDPGHRRAPTGAALREVGRFGTHID